ncbi:uncharacterized protein LOC119681665 [Teleopsis dalmanni]|uniref:uncharacterized protein LOC119681665 n=1 Tax=Teleopsis dalmanni TaxID=139649 RepID=UPI0018CF71E6|nr:uncharacterized protein LOC119681665 [Teleopsis dalmanni]
MCLYLGVADHLVDIAAYCVCRVIEMSFLFVMMLCGAKAKTLVYVPNDVER